MEENFKKVEINVQLPKENSSTQHFCEIGLFLYRKEDEFVKNNKACFSNMGLNYETMTDYDVFVAMWLMFKSLYNYTESVAFNFNIWDNKITMVNNEVVLVDKNGYIIINEEIYQNISDALREKYKDLI